MRPKSPSPGIDPPLPSDIGGPRSEESIEAAGQSPTSSVVRGVAVGFLSFGIFSVGDACIKALSGELSVFEVTFFTTIFACVAIPFVRQSGERWTDMFRMRRPRLVMVRTAAGVLAGMLSVYSFTHLPFAEVYALIFLAPLFVTLLSIPVLGESVGWRRGLAILVGFAGVLLVVRPGFQELLPAHLAAMGIALCAAATVLSLRALGPTERRITLIGVVFLASLSANGLLMLFDFSIPSPRDFILSAVAGLCGGVGHVLLMASTRAAPANRVAPAQYSQIVWAVVLGALFFAEIPDATTLAGIALVTLAGLFTFVREEERGGRWPAVWTIVWGRTPRTGGAAQSQRETRSRP
jgi:S-adenosylmethionine uptake transporter